MNPSEPVLSIGAVFTSLKLAVTAILALLALQLKMDEASTVALVSAGAAITIAVGDILAYYLTRERVTPTASPNLPIGTTVNDNSSAPSGVVTAAPEAG